MTAGGGYQIYFGHEKYLHINIQEEEDENDADGYSE
jgi:hypothetical protein